jgi:L-fucokinase
LILTIRKRYCSGDKWRSECVQIPLNAVSVVGVPEAPSVAKNHGVLVGTRSPTYNGMATHYLQKPSILEMQRAGAVFEFDDCEGGEAVYIDTGVVIFTGQAMTSFLSLLDDPSVNTCTSKGILLKKECSEKELTSADAPSALRLELYSDVLHAMSLKDSPNDLDTYFNALGISSTEVPVGNKNSTYILALKVIWSTFCRTPLHLVGIPNGMFCHLGTSAELLDLLSYCTSDVIIKSDEKALESAPRDCNDAIIFKNDKLKKFSGKYSLKEFVKSSVLTRNGSKPYKVIGDITDSSILSTVKGLKGVMLNCMCIPAVDVKGETMLRTSHRSLVEHSVLSGKCSVGQHSVVSHLPGFLGRNLEVLDGMMVQCVPILDLESVSGDSRCSSRSNAAGGGGKGRETGHAQARAQGVLQGEEKNMGTGKGLGLGQGRFVMLLFSIDDDIKVSYKDSKATVCGATWNTLFQVS